MINKSKKDNEQKHFLYIQDGKLQTYPLTYDLKPTYYCRLQDENGNVQIKEFNMPLYRFVLQQVYVYDNFLRRHLFKLADLEELQNINLPFFLQQVSHNAYRDKTLVDMVNIIGKQRLVDDFNIDWMHEIVLRHYHHLYKYII